MLTVHRGQVWHPFWIVLKHVLFWISFSFLHILSPGQITSSFFVIQDVEESGLPDREDNNLQEHSETCTQDTRDSAAKEGDADDRIYLDLIPVRSFLHTSSGVKTPPAKESSGHSPVPAEEQKDASSQVKEVDNSDVLMFPALCLDAVICALIPCLTHWFQVTPTNGTEPDSPPETDGTSSTSATGKPEQERPATPTPPQPQTQQVKPSAQNQETPKKNSLEIPQVFNSPGVQIHKGSMVQAATGLPHSPKPARPKAHTMGEDWGAGTLGSLLWPLPHTPSFFNIWSRKSRFSASVPVWSYSTRAPSGERPHPLQSKAQPHSGVHISPSLGKCHDVISDIVLSQGPLGRWKGSWARTAQRRTCAATSTSATAWRKSGRRWGALWPTWRRRGGNAKRSSAPAKVRLPHSLWCVTAPVDAPPCVTDSCLSSSDPKQQASLEARLKQKEEACREAERRRVEVELRLVEVKESLKKVESGPFTLGTTLDSSLQDTPAVSVPALTFSIHCASTLSARFSNCLSAILPSD